MSETKPCYGEKRGKDNTHNILLLFFSVTLSKQMYTLNVVLSLSGLQANEKLGDLKKLQCNAMVWI